MKAASGSAAASSVLRPYYNRVTRFIVMSKVRPFMALGLVIALVALPLFVASVPRYRQKVMAYVVDAIPTLHPWYQHGIQHAAGTPLLSASNDLMLALSTPKYNKRHNSRIYLIGKSAGGNYSVMGQTASLPEKPDPQAVAAYRGELIVANHQGRDDSIVIYDLKAAFSSELKVIGGIPNLPAPTNLTIYANRLYVTCVGHYGMRGQGIYVYEKDGHGEWAQVQRFLYRDVFGHTLFSNDYSQWGEMGPIAIAVKGNLAYVADQVSGSVALLDLSQPPEKAFLGRLSGPDSHIYYPLGIALDQERLFIAEHMYNYVAEFKTPLEGGNATPVHIFSDARNEVTPYNVLAKNGRLFIANLASPSLYAFSYGDGASTEPVIIPLPDGASITSLANINESHAAVMAANGDNAKAAPVIPAATSYPSLISTAGAYSTPMIAEAGPAIGVMSIFLHGRSYPEKSHHVRLSLISGNAKRTASVVLNTFSRTMADPSLNLAINKQLVLTVEEDNRLLVEMEFYNQSGIRTSHTCKRHPDLHTAYPYAGFASYIPPEVVGFQCDTSIGQIDLALICRSSQDCYSLL
jgi:DNA-binding beta-propeller fold protein YncE